MVSSKHFLICILLAMLINAACENSVDYSNNVINATTRGPISSGSSSSIFSDTSGKIEIETTTKLEKKYTTYGRGSLPNNGTEKIINYSLNSNDYLKNESEHKIKAEIDITQTVNTDKNSENINIAENVTTSNKQIYDNMNNGRIAETTSTTRIDEMITNSTEKITKNSTTTNFRVECDIQMNNGDPKSVRTDICGCADGYEIIEYDEFKNKINKTCVELLPETTMKSEEMKTTVSSEEQKEIRKALLYSTKADYIPSTKPKENDNRNNSFSQILATTQTDVNNHNTRFAVMATISVGPDDNRLDYSDATKKPAMPNIATTLSAEARLRNISAHSSESNTLANQKDIKLSSITRRKEKLRANGSQMTYYIIGSALVVSILIASGIIFLRNLRRNSYYEI